MTKPSPQAANGARRAVSIGAAATPLPPRGGHDPATAARGAGPGSFARAPDIGGPLAHASPDTPGMPAPSEKTAWNFLPVDWSWRDGQPVPPAGFEPRTQLEHARLGIITPEMKRVAQREGHLSAEQVMAEVAAGRMIIPANRAHLARALDPIAIGRAGRTKINANMGTSPVSSGTEEELAKLRWAERWGADTVMDLSTGGDLDATRRALIDASALPIGTVPIYAMIVGRPIEQLDEDAILEQLEHQASQGVDYFTIHAGIRRAHIPLARQRLAGIVSRGGSLLAKWMLHHGADNPMYAAFPRLCEVMRRHDVSFSLGDGLRPGALADATDPAQLAELRTLGELTEIAWRHGCQVMVEGPGHVPFDQIEYNMKLERQLCHGAPFYVLGPIVTDVFPGYDHITSAVGATAAAYHGASMLCYVTPKEHLGLPKEGDVKDGCAAYKIAAHAADVALGIAGTRDWDDGVSTARADLDWSRQYELAYDGELAKGLHDEDLAVSTDFCAMCGHDWCAVRISKEITRAPGQDSPSTKAACHSDQATEAEARRIHAARLTPPHAKPPGV